MLTSDLVQSKCVSSGENLSTTRVGVHVANLLQLGVQPLPIQMGAAVPVSDGVQFLHM